MKITEHDWSWLHPLTPRSLPLAYLVLHHEGGEGSAEAVHAYHRSLGWAGIGYHYLVDLDGTTHRGRPEWACGAHCYGYNAVSLGVAFQGNYEARESMPAAQLAAGRALIAALCEEHRGLALRAHREMPGNATDCPGRYFPLAALLAAPPATVSVARRPQLKRLMQAYALASGVRIPAGFVVNRRWGEAARTMAWRVSGRLPGVVQTAQPTVELWEALRGRR